MRLFTVGFFRKSFMLVLLLASQQLFSQTIKGKVTDAINGEPLVGATVTLEGVKGVALVKLDGTYVFTKVKAEETPTSNM